MINFSQAVDRIKNQVTSSLPEELIVDLCKQLGHRFRRRELDPVITTYLFVRQILYGNIAVADLRRRTDMSFTDSAYCQARARLPLALLQRLQEAVTGFCTDDQPSGTWHGHRCFIVDGSGFSMPDTEELQKHFGQPSQQAPGCGFPVAHLLLRFDADQGYLLQTLAAPLRTHDLSQIVLMHPELSPGDLLIGDRAFGSYAHLALCYQRNLQGLFRAHQKRIINFRPSQHRITRKRRKKARKAKKTQKGQPSSRWLKRLGKHDQLVEYFKPKKRPAWMTAEEYAKLPDTIMVRELRYRITIPGRRTRVVTLVTTLLDPVLYPAAELARLYGWRWQVETNLRHLKQTLGLDILRCESVDGVMKELTLFVLVYNLVRRVMGIAARRQKVRPERISFIDAWRWLREAEYGEELPELIVNPERPGRVEPRVRKRRPKQFPVMKRPRRQLREELLAKSHADAA